MKQFHAGMVVGATVSTAAIFAGWKLRDSRLSKHAPLASVPVKIMLTVQMLTWLRDAPDRGYSAAQMQWFYDVQSSFIDIVSERN